jgi:hypothetical protein
VETISERASAQTWTCEIRLKGGRLPDLAALDRHIKETRTGAHLRGVEATVLGRLILEKEEMSFAVTGTQATLKLMPLRRKVQWDVAAKREQSITKDEKSALERLRAQAVPPDTLLELIGPLEPEKDKNGKIIRLTLQVRAFRLVTANKNS